MTYLLDTQVFLWMQASPDRMRPDVRQIIESPDSRLYLSAASAWEIAIKYALGKLPLPAPPEEYVPRRMSSSAVEALPVEHVHALRAGALEARHRDPFDRLLIAQAQLERMPIITADRVFAQYGVETIDAR